MWVELNLHLEATATVDLVNPQRAGQGKTRRPAELVDTRSLQVEEGGYERKSRRPDDQATARTEDRTTHENHELRVRGTTHEEPTDGEPD